MDDFSPGILTDLFGQNRVFIFVGGPRQDDMIRHRAKSAWIHPNYNVCYISAKKIRHFAAHYFSRERERTTLQLYGSMSPSLSMRRSNPFACPTPSTPTPLTRSTRPSSRLAGAYVTSKKGKKMQLTRITRAPHA